MKVPDKDMHYKSKDWTGFFKLKERNLSLEELTNLYGEPTFVGKSIDYDFMTADGDTIKELYELYLKKISHNFDIIRYDWNCPDGQTLVLFFTNADPRIKPFGGYLYSDHIYPVADKHKLAKHPNLYFHNFQYWPRGGYPDDSVQWDTITKSPEWVSFRYFKNNDLSPETISYKYGNPSSIEQGKKAEWLLHYSVNKLEGVYAQTFGKFPADSIVGYYWKVNECYSLTIFYLKTERGDSAISGFYEHCMRLPE